MAHMWDRACSVESTRRLMRCMHHARLIRGRVKDWSVGWLRGLRRDKFLTSDGVGTCCQGSNS